MAYSGLPIEDISGNLITVKVKWIFVRKRDRVRGLHVEKNKINDEHHATVSIVKLSENTKCQMDE